MLIVVVTEVNEHAFFFHFSQTRRSSHAGHEYGLRHARANRLKWRHNRVRSHARANRSRKKSVTRCLPDSYVSTCFDTPVPSLWSCVWVLMFALVFDIKEAWSRIFNNPSNCFELWHRTKGNDRLILCVMCKFSCLCSQGGRGEFQSYELPPSSSSWSSNRVGRRGDGDYLPLVPPQLPWCSHIKKNVTLPSTWVPQLITCLVAIATV